MSFLRIDRSQSKTVFALIGVLVVAVGVTIVRIKPRVMPKVADQARRVEAEIAPVGGGDGVTFDRLRNPFQMPSSVRGSAATGIGPEGPGGAVNGTGLTPNPWAKTARVGVEPMGIRLPAGGGGTRESDSRQEVGPSLAGPGPTSPVFTLLATAKSSRGYSAVLKTGDSDVRVVETGDVLEGGFKVLRLDDKRAVLSDGRETIVAKRPQS